jgi:RNA polymerase-interacting CarD/CdnL/TRCF family regulator
VQSIRRRSFSGPEGPKFAKLFFPGKELIMMVRESELADVIRKPIEKSEAQKVLAHIGEWNGSTSEEWKTRANAQQRKLDNGDPFALAEVYKAMVVRKEAGTLSGADRNQLSKSEQRLSEELAAALNKPLGKTCLLMENAALS